MIPYLVTQEEREWADDLASEVQEDVHLRGHRRKDGTTGSHENDKVALIAEMVIARHLGVPPDPKVGNLDEPDLVVGDIGHHVRYTDKRNGQLIIRERDRPKMGKYAEDRFWLVVGDEREMLVVGYMSNPDIDAFLRGDYGKWYSEDQDGFTWMVRRWHDDITEVHEYRYA